MKILVVGSGGRECAIVWKLKQSKAVSKIYCAPGNGSILDIAELVDIPATDIHKLAEFACDEKIDLTVVGTEEPLSLGIVDLFMKRNLKIFGPEKRASIIEYSKEFAKDFMARNRIPTATYKSFDNKGEALQYIKEQNLPIVVKADGLAAGKGVYICSSMDQAEAALNEIMVQGKFGPSGNKVIVEEFLTGTEASILSFVDGETIVPMLSAKDYKNIFDGDKGPNTGGMGAVSPNGAYDEETARRCMQEIFLPTVAAMAKEGRMFKGILFFGLMLTADGPKVIEYNARFGDPETQVVLPMLESDLLEIFMACCDGTLDRADIKWKKGAAVCVVLASEGYPGDYGTGYEISGINELQNLNNVIVFGAGVRKSAGKLLSSGGRVLGVTALGKTVEEAADRAYASAGRIKFDNKYCRADIGRK